MHLVLYHDALIPPLKYGGTERILVWLARGLIELGHQVTLIAQPGSHIPGVQVIPLNKKFNEKKLGDKKADTLQDQYSWQELIPPSADFLHLWNTPHPLPQKPFLVTIEGQGQRGEIFHPNTVFVSQRHAQNHGGSAFVYNGIDVSEFECCDKREPYLVFLAKAKWKVKNLVGAIEIARSLQLELKVMGSRNPIPYRWRGVHYLGMLGDTAKRKLLSRAQALLFPVRWHEPFGIAITEALASGCPVYGTPYGSLPEIITPDVGLLSTSAATLARAISSQSIDPQICRQRVSQGFSYLEMTQKYLRYYDQILRTGQLSEHVEVQEGKKTLKWQFEDSAETLLPWVGLHSP